MTIIESRPRHLERAERISVLFEKLLILRLAHLAQGLSSDTRERPERARFAERWATLERMSPAGLQRASRDPHLAAWVATGEDLIRNGIYQRYPDAHPRRHLDGFGRLVVSWAAQLPEGSSGQVDLAGQTALDLSFGDAVLIGPMSDAHRTLSWHTRRGLLRVGWSDDEPIVEASLGDPTEANVAHEDWRYIAKPRAGTIPIDVWTWLRLDNDRPVDPHALHDMTTHALASVDERLRPLVDSTCRSMTASAADGRWVAGLLSCPANAACGSRELIDRACFDLVNRLVCIGSTAEAMDLPRPVLVELARRLAARLCGDDPAVGVDPEGRDRWDALLIGLRDTAAGGQLCMELDEIGGAARPPDLPAAAARTAPAPAVPNLLLPIGDVRYADVPQPLVLKKTRKGAASNVNDFTPLNALSYLPEPALREILERALSAAGGSEGAAYLAAAAAYVAGEFEICARTLARCIRFDPDVEEYWHLLAFALRFLKRYDEFTEIMFGGMRNADMLERLEPLLAPTS